jgi:hypothetical protein
MASTGHFITMIGVFFFYFMIFDAHVERRTSLIPHLGIPR